RDQRDLGVGVVVDTPAIALGERRHAKVRVALAQELLPFCRPSRLREVMEGGVNMKGNVLFVVCVRMLDEYLVLNYGLRLLGASCVRHLSFSGRAVVGDFDQRVVVVHGPLKFFRPERSFSSVFFARVVESLPIPVGSMPTTGRLGMVP